MWRDTAARCGIVVNRASGPAGSSTVVVMPREAADSTIVPNSQDLPAPRPPTMGTSPEASATSGP